MIDQKLNNNLGIKIQLNEFQLNLHTCVVFIIYLSFYLSSPFLLTCLFLCLIYPGYASLQWYLKKPSFHIVSHWTFWSYSWMKNLLIQPDTDLNRTQATEKFCLSHIYMIFAPSIKDYDKNRENSITEQFSTQVVSKGTTQILQSQNIFLFRQTPWKMWGTSHEAEYI